MATTRFRESTLKTTFKVGSVVMATHQGELTPLRVGDQKYIQISTLYGSGRDAGKPRDITSAVYWIYNPDLPVTGMASSDGTDSTLIDEDRREDDGHWVGLPIVITDTDGKSYASEITDFDSATTTISFNSIPVEVKEGWTYTIAGTPLQTPLSCNVSDNEMLLLADASLITGRPATLTLVVRATFDDFGEGFEEEIETFVGKLTVRQASYL